MCPAQTFVHPAEDESKTGSQNIMVSNLKTQTMVIAQHNFTPWSEIFKLLFHIVKSKQYLQFKLKGNLISESRHL
jgi:hypothetical protein